MIYSLDHSYTIQGAKASTDWCNPGSGPDSFMMSMADELLRTTQQYPRWETLRQQYPERVNEVAHLVLERHTYVAGKAPATEEGREHFDRITDQLKREGIYLYKSHEFESPIFPYVQADRPRKAAVTESAVETRGGELNPKTRMLRSRFAQKDCFEFLAGVLEDNGITYYGKDGVKHALMDKAQSQGKDYSACLTGEGVTQLLCREPVTINVPQMKKHSLEEIWGTIGPHLKEGAILSYSSQYFGHTGIIGQTNGRWVYINSSGSAGDRNTYRVKEEDLKHEIKGWLARAMRHNTFLNITLGAVSRGRAARFNKWHMRAHATQEPDINLLA